MCSKGKYYKVFTAPIRKEINEGVGATGNFTAYLKA
jgi:hypothetical protein